MNKPILAKPLMALDLTLNNRNDVIEVMSKLAFQHGYLSDLSGFIDSVKQREKEFSTAIGYGVGMPHGKSDTVLYPFIAFGRVVEPFLWDEEEHVKFIFLIGVPKEETALHLKFIAELSKKLLDDDYRDTLAVLKTPEDIVQHLNQIEIA